MSIIIGWWRHKRGRSSCWNGRGLTTALAIELKLNLTIWKKILSFFFFLCCWWCKWRGRLAIKHDVKHFFFYYFAHLLVGNRVRLTSERIKGPFIRPQNLKNAKKKIIRFSGYLSISLLQMLSFMSFFFCWNSVPFSTAVVIPDIAEHARPEHIIRH